MSEENAQVYEDLKAKLIGRPDILKKSLKLFPVYSKMQYETYSPLMKEYSKLVKELQQWVQEEQKCSNSLRKIEAREKKLREEIEQLIWQLSHIETLKKEGAKYKEEILKQAIHQELREEESILNERIHKAQQQIELLEQEKSSIQVAYQPRYLRNVKMRAYALKEDVEAYRIQNLSIFQEYYGREEITKKDVLIIFDRLQRLERFYGPDLEQFPYIGEVVLNKKE